MKIIVRKEDLDKCGVYKILNTLNNKFYIGCTKNFRRRINIHLSQLRRGISQSLLLQRSVSKYGIDNFEFSVLEICDNFSEREVQLIQELKPDLNISTIPSNSGKSLIYNPNLKSLKGFKGKKHTEGAKKQMSLKRKGVPSGNKGHKGYTFNRKVKKQVQSLNLSTKNCVMHKSVKEASSSTGIKCSTIYSCCNNERNSAFGYTFNYLN